MPKLVLRRKTEIVSEYLISKLTVTIGSSDDNDIVIADQPISLRHCEIFEVDGIYYLKDSKSAFGTLVNSARITQTELHFNDTIQLATSQYDLLFYPTAQEFPKLPNVPPRFFLIAIHGRLYGRKYEVKSGETRIGRDEEFNDIVVSGKVDTSVSRRHATLRYDGSSFEITDKRSRNRTFVNQKVVGESETVRVNPQDEVLIGHNIFRLVREGEEDYAAPRKAGIFLDRYKMPALRAAAAALVAVSLAAMGYAAFRLKVIMDVPGTLSMSTRAWKPPAADAARIPDAYDLSPSLAVGRHADGAGFALVLASAGGVVQLVNPADGAALWPEAAMVPSGIRSSPIIADINSDATGDVLVGGDDSRLYIFDGLSGALVYKSDILGGGISAPAACGDLNDDGVPDAVCCSDDGIVLFVYSPSASARAFTIPLGGRIVAAPVIVRDPETGRVRVVVALYDGTVYLLDGRDRNHVMIDTAEGINKFKGLALSDNEIGGAPLIADVNGDGTLDMVVASRQGYIASFNLRSTQLQWLYTLEPKPIKDFPVRTASLVAADLNGDALLEIVAAWPNGRLYALSGENGKLIWQQQTDEWNRFIGTPALADLTKDGIPDVVIGGENGFLYVVDGDAARGINLDRVIVREKVSANPLSTTPIVADFNRDGYLEIAYQDIRGVSGILSTTTRVLSGTVVWAQFRGDAANRGIAPGEIPRWVFPAIMGAGAVVLLTLFALTLFLKKRKGYKKPPVIALKEEVTM